MKDYTFSLIIVGLCLLGLTLTHCLDSTLFPVNEKPAYNEKFNQGKDIGYTRYV